jgi:uncharacterized protein YndB with AHSA1/START domain
MKPALFLVATLAGAFAQSASSPVEVVKQASPKALIFEVVVPASRPAVWEAFTTSEGLSTWLTPHAVVELKNGGEWTAHYPGGKTGGGTVLSFVSQREIVLAAMAPEQFPTVRSERTHARFEFEDRDGSTLVRLTQTGWKDGEEWDKAYEYLAKGNPMLLEALRKRFLTGPIDWVKAWGAEAVAASK